MRDCFRSGGEARASQAFLSNVIASLVMVPTEEHIPDANDASGQAQVRLDPAARTAVVAGRELKLTATEFRLLEALLQVPERPLSRAELVQTAIAGGAIVLERTIDVHICALRRKLGKSVRIETVRRVGYRLRA